MCGVYFCKTWPFNRPQRKKSAGVRSGDLGGQNFLDNSVLKKLSISRMHLKCDMLHRLVGNTQQLVHHPSID